MEWPLEESSVEFRGQTFTVREMTHGERTAWSTGDKPTILARAVVIGLVGLTGHGPLDLDAVNSMPSKLVELLAREVFRLTDPDILKGLDDKAATAKDGAEKKA